LRELNLAASSIKENNFGCIDIPTCSVQADFICATVKKHARILWTGMPLRIMISERLLDLLESSV
jgi:hypothetical protein